MERKQRIKAVWVLVGVALLATAAVVPLLVFAGSGQATLTAEPYANVIRFEVLGAASLQIQIYDLSERELWDSGAVSGDFVDWDRTDTWGERLANGYYMYLAQAWDMGGSLILSKTGKVTLLPGDQVQLQQAPHPSDAATPSQPGEDTLQVHPAALGDTYVCSQLGVGTASPSGEIDVRDAASSSLVRLNGHDVGFGSGDIQILNDGTPVGRILATKTNNYLGFIGQNQTTFRVFTSNAANASTERFRITAAADNATTAFLNSNVGIGTTSPAAKLDVYSTAHTSGSSDGIVNIGTSAGLHLTLDADDIQAKNGSGGEEDLYLNYFGGNVAVGGIIPSYALDVSGDRIRLNSPSDSRQVMLRVDGAAADLQSENADLFVRSDGGYDIHLNTFATDGAVYVGGTNKAGTGLYVTSTDATTDAVTVLIDNTNSAGDLLAGQNGADREFFFDFAGDLFLDGTTFSPADFAELMRAEESPNALEPGDVLVMLPTGKLGLSSTPYSTSLVGVYSTKPGVLGDYTSMEMAEDEPDTVTEARRAAEGPRVPVALLGIVRVKVCAENGAIRPGDVLTTSSTPGHAMKASPVVVSGMQIYPTGAILGKALEPLEAGTGIVLALITLR